MPSGGGRLRATLRRAQGLGKAWPMPQAGGWLGMEAGTLIASAGLLLSALAVAYAGWQAHLERKLRTLEFVAGAFNELTDLEARDELQRLANSGQDVLTFIGGDEMKERRLREYSYVLNRIGGGVKTGALSRRTLYEIWDPQGFIDQWRLLAPLVRQSRRQGGDATAKSCACFEWMATKECVRWLRKYPRGMPHLMQAPSPLPSTPQAQAAQGPRSSP